MFGKGCSIDLNIPVQSNDDFFEGLLVDSLADRICRSFKLGYSRVAVNVITDQNILNSTHESSSKKKKKVLSTEPVDFPLPPNKVELLNTVSRRLSKTIESSRILTRLTIKFHDNNFLPVFKRSKVIYPYYDLIAIQPSSTDSLVSLLKTDFHADIISFTEPKLSQNIRWSRKLFKDCVKHGMFFELSYSTLMLNNSSTNRMSRSELIHQAHAYMTAVGGDKFKSVFVSSSALKVSDLRSPSDVCCLTVLFGVNNESDSRNIVCAAPQEVVKSGVGRKIGPYRATLTDVSEVKVEERWKIPTDLSIIDRDLKRKTSPEKDNDDQTAVIAKPPTITNTIAVDT